MSDHYSSWIFKISGELKSIFWPRGLNAIVSISVSSLMEVFHLKVQAGKFKAVWASRADGKRQKIHITCCTQCPQLKKNKPIHCNAPHINTHPHVGSRSRSVTGSLWWLSFRETLFAILRFSLNCWNWKVSRDIILFLCALPSLQLMLLAEKVQHRKKR